MVIEANGASGIIYANETYQLQVVFPEHYLTEAPQVNFAPPAPLHPHIYSDGNICLEWHEHIHLNEPGIFSLNGSVSPGDFKPSIHVEVKGCC